MRLRGSFIVACGLVSGCLVSFDGYQLGTDGAGQGAVAAAAGEENGGKATGGKGGAGKSSGDAGHPGDAGAAPSEGGERSSGAGDAAGQAGSERGGTSSGGGNAGSGGTSGGGASSGGSSGGNAGSGGGGGAAGGKSGNGGGGNGGSGGNPPKSCPLNVEGPAMIEVPKSDGGIYCIDRTEVPNEDYAAFLATNPSTASQSAACSWNNSFQPDTSTACVSASGAYDPVARPRVPVSCIDWCDAKRYCEWAGKHLCGKIGGGNNPPASYVDASASQWYRACSRAGARSFPYGNQYQATYCNGVDSPYVHPASVANAANCEGGYNGLFDMSGNVAEWEDSCSASSGATDNCLIRGGSLENAETTVPSLLCNSSAVNDSTPSYVAATRSTKDEFIGFRCCYDP